MLYPMRDSPLGFTPRNAWTAAEEYRDAASAEGFGTNQDDTCLCVCMHNNQPYGMRGCRIHVEEPDLRTAFPGTAGVWLVDGSQSDRLGPR
jgi:hypothetical protein